MMTREIDAIVFAPLVAATPLVLGLHSFAGIDLPAFGYAVLDAYLALVVWIPVLLWMRRRGWTRLWQVLLSSLTPAILFWIPLYIVFQFLIPISEPDGTIISVPLALFLIGCWLGAGLVCWLIGVKNNNQSPQPRSN